MLSPRTMSLRIKSRALLKTVDKYLVIMTKQINVSDKNLDGTDNHVMNLELDCPIQRIGDSSLWSQPGVLSQELFTEGSVNNYNRDIVMKERDAAPNKSSEGIEKCLAEDEHGSSCFGTSLKIDPPTILSNEIHPRAPTIISRIRNKARKQESSSTDSVFRKSRGQIDESYIANHRSKSVSLEQQRAAEAQMHAPTHSHSTSKCYCTNNSYVREQPDKRYVVQVHGLKQHIPDRLKRARYRADSIPKQPRFIKWADSDKDRSGLQADDISLLPFLEKFKMKEDCYESHQSISNQSTHRSHGSQGSLFDKVKMFRETHWSDCHALREKTLSSHHKCALHYVPNNRLFLEPVYTNDSGDDSCPVCLLPSDDLKKSVQEGTLNHFNLNDNSHEDQSSLTLVTLPSHMLEPEFGGSTISRTLAFEKNRRERGHSPREKSHFCVGHHNIQVFHSNPSDSLALRFQK